MPLRLSPTQQLRYAGLFTWACVGIPMLWVPWYFGESGGLVVASIIAWRIAYFVFGATYWVLTRRLDTRVGRVDTDLPLLFVMTGAAVAVSHFSDSGLGSILLMLSAGVLPWLLGLRVGLIWVVAMHAALLPVFLRIPEYTPLDAVLQAVLYVGFSSFVYVTSYVARQQVEAQQEQRRLNAELRATRALLAESSRLSERMRISRELHDLLGHHLTALSLNLEVASHLSSGRVQEHVRQAQTLARLLLSDVREAVSQLRENDTLDIADALRRLADGVPALEVDIAVPASLKIDDLDRAQVILRCAQEIITNTVRHAGAGRLELQVSPRDGGVALHARDDGRGTSQLEAGNGLRGMRERLEQFGGSMHVESAAGRGFELDLWLPLAEQASVR